MNCRGCNIEIDEKDSYFRGTFVPPRNTNKFGCSPHSNYCIECTKKMPNLFWKPDYKEK